jgi:hypothetical protein
MSWYVSAVNSLGPGPWVKPVTKREGDFYRIRSLAVSLIYDSYDLWPTLFQTVINHNHSWAILNSKDALSLGLGLGCQKHKFLLKQFSYFKVFLSINASSCAAQWQQMEADLVTVSSSTENEPKYLHCKIRQVLGHRPYLITLGLQVLFVCVMWNFDNLSSDTA